MLPSPGYQKIFWKLERLRRLSSRGRALKLKKWPPPFRAGAKSHWVLVLTLGEVGVLVDAGSHLRLSQHLDHLHRLGSVDEGTSQQTNVRLVDRELDGDGRLLVLRHVLRANTDDGHDLTHSSLLISHVREDVLTGVEFLTFREAISGIEHFNEVPVVGVKNNVRTELRLSENTHISSRTQQSSDLINHGISFTQGYEEEEEGGGLRAVSQAPTNPLLAGLLVGVDEGAVLVVELVPPRDRVDVRGHGGLGLTGLQQLLGRGEELGLRERPSLDRPLVEPALRGTLLEGLGRGHHGDLPVLESHNTPPAGGLPSVRSGTMQELHLGVGPLQQERTCQVRLAKHHLLSNATRD